MKFTKFFVLLIIITSIVVMLLSRDAGEEHIVVCGEMDKVVLNMPMEEYMLGVMAATIDPTYELECQKALAILIRSNLEAGREGKVITVSENDIYYDYVMRSNLYGENQKEYEEKLATAIYETTGMVAVSGNNILEGDFHALSAGMTRETVDSASVSCIKSMEAEDFFFQKTITEDRIGEVGGIIRDDAGYVEEITLNGQVISGEYFRTLLQLPSANFEIEKQGEKYLITTRGKGHGLGMDLYYANELAKQGYTYDQILAYFFKDFILKKIIV